MYWGAGWICNRREDGEGAVETEWFVKNPKKDDGYGERRSGRVT